MLSAAAKVKGVPAKALIYAVLQAKLCYICQSGKDKPPKGNKTVTQKRDYYKLVTKITPRFLPKKRRRVFFCTE